MNLTITIIVTACLLITLFFSNRRDRQLNRRLFGLLDNIEILSFKTWNETGAITRRQKEAETRLQELQNPAEEGELRMELGELRKRISHLDVLAQSNQEIALQIRSNLNIVLDDTEAWTNSLSKHIVTLSGAFGSLKEDVGLVPSVLNSQLSTLNKRLLSIESVVKIWGKAQTANEIKEGESNRTLRRRLQEKESVLAATRQTLKSQSDEIKKQKLTVVQTQAAARDALAETMAEIAESRRFLSDRGLPVALLDKHLNGVFKGSVPSLVYARIKNEEDLRQTTLQQIPNVLQGLAAASPKISATAEKEGGGSVSASV